MHNHFVVTRPKSRRPLKVASGFYTFIVVLFSALICCGLPTVGAFDEPVSFNQVIRPILADKCFHCHGPDSATREADLKLDSESGMFPEADEKLVVKGDADSSLLFQRLVHDDPTERMPPEDSNRSLTQQEIDQIRLWIDQGAKWEKHWAFIPPQRAMPAHQNSPWIENEIDRFVLAKLMEQGLKPSAKADKVTLIRRVTQDLTGLPPTLEEIDQFLKDDTAGAYEKVVDRLLKSPHYGERMTQVWLDAARYADSHGYSLDRRRVMWPWRDWVIKAYNDNKRFDDFLVEQLAGDLLPNATIEQQIATGFNRNHPIQSEGGVINEEYRIETVVDRVETTSAVFLGLTMGCGRCHDHKYEPISQKEFYQFFAFFNNVPETAHVGNADNQVDKPFVKAPSVLARDRLAALEARILGLKKELVNRPKSPAELVEKVWIEDDLPKGAVSFGNGDGAKFFDFVEQSDLHPVYSGKKSSYRTSKGMGQHGFQGATDTLPVTEESKFFTYVFIDSRNPPQEIMLQWNVGGSWEHRAYWGQSKIDWGVEKTASRFHMGPIPETGKWIRLEIPAKDVGLVGKRISGWAFTQFDGTLHWDKSGIVSAKLDPLQEKIQQMEQQVVSLTRNAPMVMVMSEMKPARKTFVLNRGQYDAPTDVQVQPGIPKVLGDLPGKQRNRLALAQWMVSPNNPLTARVAVNRYWQMYFGKGLVATVEDFGTQGTPPTHPRLLDYLAVEFIRSGWDIKGIQKKIVMSATYQQSSKVKAKTLIVDPANQWLARGPRFRLSAEAIRDQALFVSGLMVPTLGGPSVRPYQPPGLWKDVVYSNVPKFKQDHGDKLYRRSLYTYWKRSVPPPNMQALDAPSREACTLTRSRTNTPQGTLVLWNDPTFVEAARILAEKVVRKRMDRADSLKLLFRLVLSRYPKFSELQKLEETFGYFEREFTSHPASATDLLKTGEYPRDPKLESSKVSAMTAVANALLGLDEAVTKN